MRPGISLLLLICLLSITANSFSDNPPANTIPVIGLKANYEDIDTEFFCLLSWHNYDGLSRQYYQADSILAKVVLSGDTTGMLTVINPWNLTSVTNWYSHMFEMNTDSAYSRPGWKGLVYYIGSTAYTCNGDTVLANKSPSEMIAEMTSVAEDLETLFNQDSHSVWFYYGYDEAPAIAQGEANVTSDPAAHNLYTTNSIQDLNMGLLMLQTSNDVMHLSIQLQETSDLASGTWTNAGDAVEWQYPAADGKAFFRIRSE